MFIRGWKIHGKERETREEGPLEGGGRAALVKRVWDGPSQSPGQGRQRRGRVRVEQVGRTGGHKHK